MKELYYREAVAKEEINNFSAELLKRIADD